ncbi:MAG TPA: hypothetical protein VK846_13490 [Candidatus Limnocylindria bacterium]|nr:hypothetical protein [Candidatus Limnocylindria bacterium]
MQIRTQIILIISAAVFIVLGMLFVRHIGGPRVVARAVAPDGTEMCIVQRCNWNAEPFTTSFVYRKPGSTWGWFYFVHQEGYWGTSRATLDTNAGVAVFYRGTAPAVTFAWATEIYTMHRWNRTMTGAQSRLPAGWSLHLSVH